jgi:hypothetical protein
MLLNVQAVILLAQPIPQPKSTLPGPSTFPVIANLGHLGVLSETELEEDESEAAEIGVGNEKDDFFL